MRYYPVQLDVQNRNCLVVGGGGVATRKVQTLLKCGARVTVVSPDTGSELEELARNNVIVLKKRGYRRSDVSHMFLVIGATDDKDLNRQIFNDAEALGRLCNIADLPEACNFILPSVVHQGDLVIAISTSGKSPAFAKHLRKDLEKMNLAVLNGWRVLRFTGDMIKSGEALQIIERALAPGVMSHGTG